MIGMWKGAMAGAKAMGGRMGATGANVAIGAAAGGLGAATTDRSIAGGMLVGGVAGAGLGSRMGQKAIIDSGRRIHQRMGQKGVQGWSRSVANGASMMTSKTGRRMVMGAGAGLSGAMFGGRKSHRRGFNSQRGNHIMR